MCNLSEWVLEQGIEQGLNTGIELTKKVWKLASQGISIQEIADSLQISVEKVEKILE